MTKPTRRRPRTSSPVSIAEQEVVIRLDRATTQAHIASSWPAKSHRLRALYGEPVDVARDAQGNVTTEFWVVPIARITFRRLGTRHPGHPQSLARARTAPTQGDAFGISPEATEDS